MSIFIMQTIEKVYIQPVMYSHEEEEETKSLVRALIQRGIPYEKTQTLEGKEVNVHTPVIGGIEVMTDALRKLGISLTEKEVNTYPTELHPYLKRSIVKTKAKYVVNVDEPVFVKPYSDTKKFTGYVYTYDGPLRVVDPEFDIWMSSVVKLRSEWRYFVYKGEIVGRGHYYGTRERPSIKVVENIIKDFKNAPISYCIDVGLQGRVHGNADEDTILIEINDGYSFGTYGGVSGDVHLDMLLARWFELTQ